MLNQNTQTQTQEIQVRVQMIKNVEKVNLTYSVSQTINLCGKIIGCKNFFSPSGRDMSQYVLEGKGTALLPHELGRDVLIATKKVFDSRVAVGDPNPVVEIVYYCKKLVQRNGYLITDVVDFTVLSDTNILDQSNVEFDEEAFIIKAQRIKEETSVSNAAALEASRLGKPFRNHSLNNQALKTSLSKPVAVTKVHTQSQPVNSTPSRRTHILDSHDLGF